MKVIQSTQIQTSQPELVKEDPSRKLETPEEIFEFLESDSFEETQKIPVLNMDNLKRHNQIFERLENAGVDTSPTLKRYLTGFPETVRETAEELKKLHEANPSHGAKYYTFTHNDQPLSIVAMLKAIQLGQKVEAQSLIFLKSEENFELRKFEENQADFNSFGSFLAWWHQEKSSETV